MLKKLEIPTIGLAVIMIVAVMVSQSIEFSEKNGGGLVPPAYALCIVSAVGEPTEPCFDSYTVTTSHKLTEQNIMEDFARQINLNYDNWEMSNRSWANTDVGYEYPTIICTEFVVDGITQYRMAKWIDDNTISSFENHRNDSLCDKWFPPIEYELDYLENAPEPEKIFVIDGYEIISNSSAVSEILLDWDNPQLPEGEIILDQPINGTITIQIPKSMPRTMNLNFGSILAPFGEQRTNIISESESVCYYLVSFKFENKDHMKFGSASMAAGNLESVSILDQSCGEFSLKQQLENNMYSNEIECKNEIHILTERPTGKLACVYETTAKKLDWKLMYDFVTPTVRIPLGAVIDGHEMLIPKVITVVLGENNTITWINEDDTFHGIASDYGGQDGGAIAGLLKPGESYSITFDKSGIFPYHGEPHPWMKGTVIVLEE